MKVIILSISLFFSYISFAQSSETEVLQTVQQQLDAYNSTDVEAFSKVFAEDAVFVEFSNGDTSIAGKDEIIKRFSSFFDKNSNLQSNLAGRIAFGNTIIDHEKITGIEGKELYELVVIYEVRNGLIHKVTTNRK